MLVVCWVRTFLTGAQPWGSLHNAECPMPLECKGQVVAGGKAGIWSVFFKSFSTAFTDCTDGLMWHILFLKQTAPFWNPNVI